MTSLTIAIYANVRLATSLLCEQASAAIIHTFDGWGWRCCGADVSIKEEKIGRMVFVLFSEESPLQAENMRQLCTGERVSRIPRRAVA